MEEPLNFSLPKLAQQANDLVMMSPEEWRLKEALAAEFNRPECSPTVQVQALFLKFAKDYAIWIANPEYDMVDVAYSMMYTKCLFNYRLGIIDYLKNRGM
jgi:hypothetical protein